VIILADKLKACGGLHKYSVCITKDGKISNIQPTELSCTLSFGINNKSFMSRFKSYNIKNYKDRKYTDAITGATQSCHLTDDIVRRALALFQLMTGTKQE
jgi:hypothetical protein